MISPARQYSACSVAAGLMCAGWIMLHLSGARVIHENGAMENQQAICLSLASLAFAIAAGKATARHEKLFELSLALFCAMFLLRELELERTTLPEDLVNLLTGTPRNLLILACWIPLAAAAWPSRTTVWRAFAHWLSTPPGRLMLIAGVFYGLTWPLDKQFLPLPKRTSVFVEELGDSTATLLILLSGAITATASAPVRRGVS